MPFAFLTFCPEFYIYSISLRVGYPPVRMGGRDCGGGGFAQDRPKGVLWYDSFASSLPVSSVYALSVFALFQER